MSLLSLVLVPCENLFYRICGVDRHDEMGWQRYATAMLLFNLALFLSLFGILLAQPLMPMNPQGLPGLSWPLALNTAVSFVTNTNWQNYAGESTLSYFTQMAGLTVHNFVSPPAAWPSSSPLSAALSGAPPPLSAIFGWI